MDNPSSIAFDSSTPHNWSDVTLVDKQLQQDVIKLIDVATLENTHIQQQSVKVYRFTGSENLSSYYQNRWNLLAKVF